MISHLHPTHIPSWYGIFDPLLESLANRTFWYYGTGENSRPIRPNIGSVFPSATTDSDHPLQIRHLVLQGSSQWATGRNVTSNSDIQYAEQIALRMRTGGGQYDLLTLSIYDLHCFVTRRDFDQQSEFTTALSAVICSCSAGQVDDLP